jgi:hypothetical protein
MNSMSCKTENIENGINFKVSHVIILTELASSSVTTGGKLT